MSDWRQSDGWKQELFELEQERRSVYHKLVLAIKEAIAAWKRQRRLRHNRASTKDPFTN
jgi:hypothetical protein